jgi:tRNA A37 threonylcarbamoyladenosine biosynthesis protein TsaE
LGSVHEFDDLDIDLPNSIVLVEWGRGFAEDLTDTWLDLEIKRSSDPESDERTVKLSGVGKRWDEVLR